MKNKQRYLSPCLTVESGKSLVRFRPLGGSYVSRIGNSFNPTPIQAASGIKRQLANNTLMITTDIQVVSTDITSTVNYVFKVTPCAVPRFIFFLKLVIWNAMK